MMQRLHPYTVSPRSADGTGASTRGPLREPVAVIAPVDSAAYRERIRVQVAHEVPLITTGVAAILSSSREFEVMASRAVGMADVLVADLEEGLRALASGVFGRRVLVIAQDDGEAVIRRAVEKGVRGFLLHTCGVDELRNAVRTVSRGGMAFAPSVTNRIVQSLAFQPLTARELEILHLMVHGFSDKDMARKLVIAPGTVKAHMKAILTKLGAARRTEAAAIAQRRGLARVDDVLESADAARQ